MHIFPKGMTMARELMAGCIPLKCHFFIDRIDDNEKIVYFIDGNTGGMSVTNDAEAVVKFLNDVFPDYRLIYRDTENRWDELVHEHGVFKEFKCVTR
jgi:hypothetical protein